MKRSKKIGTDVERAQIMALHKEGYSERSISERVKCSKNAVHNAVVKFQKSGTYSDAKRSGKNTPRDDRVIRRTAVWSLMSSASKIWSILLAKRMDVSRRTISWRLVDDFGLKACIPAKNPRLTLAIKVKHLGFTKKHAKWAIQQWQQVFFLTNLQYSSSLHTIAMSVDPLESDLMNGTPHRA